MDGLRETRELFNVGGLELARAAVVEHHHAPVALEQIVTRVRVAVVEPVLEERADVELEQGPAHAIAFGLVGVGVDEIVEAGPGV